ncbi:MAG: hypothetical protein ACYC61_08030 [Isosphaeraceae bacterium]
MSTCTKESPPRALQLPDAFEDLTGVIASDLKVIVSALGQRATERLMLSPRRRAQFQCALWNRLADALTETLEPFKVERH